MLGRRGSQKPLLLLLLLYHIPSKGFGRRGAQQSLLLELLLLLMLLWLLSCIPTKALGSRTGPDRPLLLRQSHVPHPRLQKFSGAPP